MFRKSAATNSRSPEPGIVLGRKSKKQILRDSENRFLMFLVGNLVWITGIILLIIFSGSEFDRQIGFLILIVSYISAIILVLLGLRCPFCDSLKRHDRSGGKYISIQKASFKCYTCNLNNKQISEIVDLLKRDVEITPETIARFNRREL